MHDLMKAAVVLAANQPPTFTTFERPAPRDGFELIEVHACALSNLTKAVASGAHYSAEGLYPSVPGVDGAGVNTLGQRVYFALADAPYGALAQTTRVASRHCIPIPDGLDDITAAAVANPGMSAWAALMERARLMKGETVLINGATGSAGRMAVALARHLGAGRIIATGRNTSVFPELLALGADACIPLDGTSFQDLGACELSAGVDVIIDYLWGESACALLAAAARHAPAGRTLRFVQVGSAAGTETIALPASVLRSSSLVLMGSGLKSVSLGAMMNAVQHVFDFAVRRLQTAPHGLNLPTRVMPLSAIREAWQAPGTPRVVVSLREA
jgi:NADPH:quinone reductase-like Zn-dependent oxidoreductase